MFNSNINSSIARDMVPITPSDTADNVYFGIKCKGTAGNMVIVTKAGNTRTVPIEAGELEPISVVKVLLTGTTATGLWGYKVFVGQ